MVCLKRNLNFVIRRVYQMEGSQTNREDLKKDTSIMKDFKINELDIVEYKVTFEIIV